jgi:hypothetical protein
MDDFDYRSPAGRAYEMRTGFEGLAHKMARRAMIRLRVEEELSRDKNTPKTEY